MKTLTLAAAAVLALGLGVAHAASPDGAIFVAQAQQTQQPAGLMGGGASSKPNQLQTDNGTTNPGGLQGGGGSAKPNQKQGGNASTNKPQ